MARIKGKNIVVQSASIACGASDADNKLTICVPSPSATLVQMAVAQGAAGTGTGTFSVQATYGAATAIGAATAVTFVDADATAGTVHGVHPVRTIVRGQEGKLLGITTVKTGTVSGNATLSVTLTWRL